MNAATQSSIALGIAAVLGACTWCPEDYEARDGACVLRRPWPAGCPDEVGVLSTDGLLYAGTNGDYFEFGTIVLESQAELDAFLAGLYDPPNLPDVDFDASVVLGVATGIGSTCGAGIVDQGLADSATLVVRILDSSGACSGQCDMDMQFLVLYAVPREASDPTACVEIAAVCDAD